MKVADGSVKLLTREEAGRDYQQITGYRVFAELLEKGRCCSAASFEDCIMGMLVIPDKESLPAELLRCGFYMDDAQLFLVCDDARMVDIMNEVMQAEEPGQWEMGLVLYALMEHMLRDDVEFLEQYEKGLALLEDSMAEEIRDIPSDFDRVISTYRREMRKLMGYYKLLNEVAHVVDEALFRREKHRSRQMFAYLGNRIGRLYSDAEGIAAYAMQIRDVYTSKVSMRQNQVMQTLTIVTAIFMPLTLLAGWYGMNFAFMPELTYRYGYLLAGILAVVVVAVEIIIFKRKKWF